MNPCMLASLIGEEQPASVTFKKERSNHWRHLKAENAPFRVVTPRGMVSAPVDYFDRSILERVTAEWKRTARVVGETMAYTDEPYMQVGDVMLKARIAALVDAGRLLADGDPWDMRSSVRLAEASLP